MDQVNSLLSDLTSKIQDALEEDIAHLQLGDSYNFKEANDFKNKACKYFLNIIDEYDKNSEKIEEFIFIDAINKSKSQVDQLPGRINQFKALSEKIHDQSFPNQREKLTSTQREMYKSFKRNFSEIESKFDLINLERSIPKSDKIEREIHASIERAKDTYETLRKSLEEEIIIINDKNKQIEKSLDIAQSKAQNETIRETITDFSEQASHHRNLSIFWFIATIAFSLFLYVIIKSIYDRQFSDTIDLTYLAIDPIKNLLIPNQEKSFLLSIEGQYLINIVKNFLLISLVSIFLKLSLNKFNFERNLHIIYKHRQKVLAQYPSLENGLNPEDKSIFRQEVAKYIFTDPLSPSIQDGAEINVNPVLQTAEKMTQVGK